MKQICVREIVQQRFITSIVQFSSKIIKMTFKFFDKLSQDFSELLNDKKEYNVVIEVDKERNKKSFTAHSVVLRYRSSYFDKEENAATNENHIIKPNISVQIFEIILK